MKAVIDNDVLFKGACYGLLDKLISTICSSNGIGVLGSARFVVPKKIQKASLKGKPAAAWEAFFSFLRQAKVLEPGEDEQRFAADLELAAQKLGVNLDGGESQLCAILVQRALPLLLTGDKRAITAIETLLDADSRLTPICGRVKCLEQVFAAAIGQQGFGPLRLAVCCEPEIDKALAICFSCKSQAVEPASILEGLQSYVNNLRQLACRVLAP